MGQRSSRKWDTTLKGSDWSVLEFVQDTRSHVVTSTPQNPPLPGMALAVQAMGTGSKSAIILRSVGVRIV